MPFIPTSFNRLFTSLKSNKATPDNKSDITLFDDLPAAEKQQAIIKLQELAGQQPKPKRKSRLSWKLAIMVFFGLSFVTAAVLAGVALGVDNDVNPDLVAKLRMANTNLDRMKLLPDDSDWFFDFTKSDKYTFAPGGVINANAATFPATVGQGMTMVSKDNVTSISAVTDRPISRLYSTLDHAVCFHLTFIPELQTLSLPCQVLHELS